MSKRDLGRFPYFKLYPDDFMDATRNWPGELKGAYSVLLTLLYWLDGKLADDPQFIAGHLGYSVRKWNTLKAELISRGKIAVSGGMIQNTRADKELNIRRTFQKDQAEKGAQSHKHKASREAAATSAVQASARATSQTSQFKDLSEVPNGTSAAEPRVDAPPIGSGGDVWTLAAEAINPGDPKKGRKVVGVINTEEVTSRLGGAGAKSSAVFRQAVLALIQTGFTGETAIEYLRKTARRIATDVGGESQSTTQPEKARLFSVIEEDGVRYRVDKTTGARIEIGRAA